MTLEQIRTFVAVAEGLNMTRAAEALHLTQPAVSAAIASLEGRHRVRLFDRVGRGLALTEAGQALLPEARAVLRQADLARRTLDDLSGLVRGELRIHASQTVATYWLPSRLAQFATRYPGLSIALTVGNTAQAVAAVAGGDADLGFVEGSFEHDRIAQRHVDEDRIGFYVASGHPLAGRRIGASEMASAVWVLREPGSGTRDHFMAVLQGYGLAPSDLHIRLELPSNGAVLEAVRAGGLITAISSLAAEARVRSGLLAEVHCDLPPRIFRMLWQSERTLGAAARAFRSAIEAEHEPLSDRIDISTFYVGKV